MPATKHALDQGHRPRSTGRCTKESGTCTLHRVAGCYAAAMAAKPRIAIVGPGRLGSALALELRRAGYQISEIISGNSGASRRSARALARQLHARVGTGEVRV